jgi:chaperonin cofactor prefoldin
MTSTGRISQFTHLKQPASDYLSQTYQISSQLNDLVEALKQLCKPRYRS